MGASSVPVAGHRLGVKGYDDAEVFSDTLETEAGQHFFIASISSRGESVQENNVVGRHFHLEKVAADPEVITHVDALSGPHLVLPLGGHHLGVGSGYPGETKL